MSECIIWTRGQSQGYGVKNLKVDGRWSPIRTHRLAYEAVHGPIPEGMHVHHTCLTKRCINPDHLELLTPPEHRQRHRQTHCKRGHEMTPENVYIRPDTGQRSCGPCQDMRNRKRYENKERVKLAMKCAICGDDFIARKSDALYCSQKCRYIGWKRRHANEEAA